MSRRYVTAAALVAVLPLAGLGVATPSTASPRVAERVAERGPGPVRIVAHTRRTQVDAGRVVRIRGRVTSRVAGHALVLQQRVVDQDRWRAVDTGRVSTSGDFVLRHLPTARGEYLYRVVKPTADGLARSVSNEVPLTVWSTTTLVGFVEGARSGVDTDAVVRVNTDERSSSIVLSDPGTTGYVEYTLGRKCDRLVAQYALTDESETGASGGLVFTVDGRPAASHTMTTGTLEIVVVDVRDAFRVRLDLQGSASPSGTPAVLSPYVHCGP